jgi:hypothetical protein
MAVDTAPDAASPSPAGDRAPSTSRRRTGILVAIAAGVVAILALVAGGVFALTSFLGGGVAVSASESARAFPASTYLWAEVAIDPSPAQKLEALEMIGNLPQLQERLQEELPEIDFANPSRDTDLKEGLWRALVDSGEFGSVALDYDDDIAPWLGSRVAFGLVEGGPLATPAFIVAIQASDTDRGVEALRQLLDDAAIEGSQVSSREGFVLVSSTEVELDAAFAEGSLADRPVFADAADRLGSWGLVSTWHSTRGVSAEAAVLTEQAFESEGFFDPATWAAEFRTASEEYDRAAAAYTESCMNAGAFDYSAGQSFESDLFTGYCWDVVSPQAFEERYGFAPGEWEAAATERADHYRQLADAQLDAIDDIPDGAVVGAMRFADAGVEITSETVGVDFPRFDPAQGAALETLPASTMASVSFSPLGSIIDTVLSTEFLETAPQLAQFSALGEIDPGIAAALPESDAVDLDSMVVEARGSLEDAFAEVGLRFPEDLAALFGRSITFVADRDLACGSECSEPRFGAVVDAEDPDETMALYGDLLNAASDFSGGEIVLEMIHEGNRVAFGVGDYADELLAEGDRLGEVPRFATALPDADDAAMAFYLDIGEMLTRLDASSGDAMTDAESLGILEGLAAIGATTVQNADGDLVTRVRITTEP